MQMRRRNGAYGGIPGYNQGTNPLEDYAQQNPPPESNPPQYEDPILPGGRPPMPPAERPPDVPIDPGLGGGDGSGSSSGVGPGDIPPAAPPPEEVPIDPGLGGGDGSGSSSGVGPANDCEPHPMYNPIPWRWSWRTHTKSISTSLLWDTRTIDQGETVMLAQMITL